MSAAATARAKKIVKVVIDFPEQLFLQAEQTAAELSINRSRFIRLAVESFISQRQREKLEQELMEGYLANASVARQTAEEFAFVDSDIP